MGQGRAQARVSRVPAVILALTIAALLGSAGATGLLSAMSLQESHCSQATITGTSRGEVIKGTNGDDVIAGLGGDDVIKAKGGNDIVCGGDGNDDLIAGPGNDRLDGSAGDNSLDGGPGTDTCSNGTSVKCELTPSPSPSPSQSSTNAAPTITTNASDRTYVEDDGSDRAIDNGLTVSDPDSSQLQGATVRITGNFNPAEDELVGGNPDWVSYSYDDSTGTLTVFGTATVAQYQDALRGVQYLNSSNNPSGTKTVSFQVTDVQGAASNVASRTIVLIADDDPTT